MKHYFSQHIKAAMQSWVDLASEKLSTLFICMLFGITLLLPVGLTVLVDNVKTLTNTWGAMDEAKQVSLYLNVKNDAAIKRLKTAIAKRANVTSVIHVSPEQGLQDMKAAGQLSDAMLDGLEENPLPSVLQVQPAASITLSDLKRLQESLQELPGVEHARFDFEWLQRLQAVLDVIKRFANGLALLMSAALIMVVANTIRMAIDLRRQEIRVSKLVGATDRYVRRSYLYMGFWYGVGGGIVATVLMALIGLRVNSQVAQLAALYGSEFRLAGLGFADVWVVWLMGGLLGVLGAWLAVNRYLSKIEPA